MPKRRVNKVEIPGRHGSLHYDEKTYADDVIPITCAINVDDQEELVNLVYKIKGWLSCGESDLILSNQPNLRYKAQVVNKIDFTAPMLQFGEFVIMFECEPFASFLDETPIILEKPERLYNDGTYPAEPIITVYGEGEITLNIHGQIITLKNVSEYITMNTVLQDAYKGDDLKNSDMYGDFPILEVGTNLITWEGNVTKIEIIPNFNNI
jgi:predicted phage tail component-like protein